MPDRTIIIQIHIPKYVLNNLGVVYVERMKHESEIRSWYK